MEKTEINKLLFTFVNPDGCWHEWMPDSQADYYRCSRCKEKKGNLYVWATSAGNPDYTSEDSLRRLLAEVETKFIAEFGITKYASKLRSLLNGEEDGFWTAKAITASALTRATAMAEYLKERE